MVIANDLATHIVDEVCAAPDRHSSLDVLGGVYRYAVLAFPVVCLGCIFFRAVSFGRGGAGLGRLFSAWGHPAPLVTTSVVAAIVVGVGAQYVRPAALAALLRGFGRLPVPAQAVTVAV